jgi:hypothetical protein
MSHLFESDLRDRLQQLAAAVPVERAAERSGAGGPTRVRASTWHSAIGARSPLPVLAVVALAVVGVGILGIGRVTAPGGGPAGTGPVSATTIDGPFALTITSARGRYNAGDVIDVHAKLAFLGPAASVGIGHGDLVAHSPIGFSVEEPIFGNLRLGTVDRLMCGRSTLLRDQPIEVAFGKGGAWDGNDPQASAFEAYVRDPVFRLPPGTWHVRALADVSIGTCSADAYRLSVAIELQVADPSGSVPPAVTPSPPLGPSDLPIGDDTQDGPIQLTMSSPHRQVRAGDPITVTAGLANGGEGAMTTYGGSSGPVTFALRQVGGSVVMTSKVAPGCAEQVTLPVLQPLQVSFAKSGVLTGTDADPGYWSAWLTDPVLRLPAGSWEIYAEPAFSLSTDCSTPAPNVHPSITIQVVP